MKKVKNALAVWSKATYSNIFEKIATLEDTIKNKEVQLEISQSQTNRSELSKAEVELRSYLHIEKTY